MSFLASIVVTSLCLAAAFFGIATTVSTETFHLLSFLSGFNLMLGVSLLVQSLDIRRLERYLRDRDDL